MHPHFEKGTGYLILEWYEKRENGSPIHHYYSQIPTYLQLHPKDPMKVVRATFADKIPSWMEKYAKEHDFRCQQVTRSGEVGWWIANWRIYPNGHKPLTSPHLDGAFEQFTRLIPDVCEDLKIEVLGNRETIKMNLRNYPDAYQEFGLYFRPEEMKGQGGALLIEDFIPSQETDESDEDYRIRIERDGRLEKLVFELKTPLPEPVREEETVEEVLVEDEMELDIEFADEDEELSLEGLEFEDVSEDEEVSLEGMKFEDETEESSVTEASPDVAESEIEDIAAAAEQEELVAEVRSEAEEEETVEIHNEEEEELLLDEESEAEAVESVVEDEVNDTTEEKEELNETPLLQELKVADTQDKKVVEGQFSLF